MRPPQEIIVRLRDGVELECADIEEFSQGLAGNNSTAWSEGQIAAFAMAVFFRGLPPERIAELTQQMVKSGDCLDWERDHLPGPVLDKHSSGGVGDKLSLPLAPIIAACGGFVPMISGRGLGHSGGTLDKLDSIPGYVSQPDVSLFRRVVKDVGCAIIGQTAELAPADRRLYAIRDVTGTVESVPLITASILSKKLAAGLQGLVMDVKVGNGAFCRTQELAMELAQSIVRTARAAGLPTTALITDMNRVLGRAAGNAVEVRESIDLLTGRGGETRQIDIILALAAELLCLGGLAPDLEAAWGLAHHAFTSGQAAEYFGRMVKALGGPADLLERPDEYLPQALIQRPCFAERSGYIQGMDVREIGMAIVRMGGGRLRASDAVDHAPGFTELATVGEAVGGGVGGGRPLAIIHVSSEDAYRRAEVALRSALTIDESPPQELESSPILKRIAE